MTDDHRLLATLSEREREVLAMVAEGLSLSDIALRLHRSRKTIQSHRLSIGRKLGLRNRVELARLAIRAGLVSAGGGKHAAADHPDDETPPALTAEPVMFILNPLGQILYAPAWMLILWKFSAEIQILGWSFADLWVPGEITRGMMTQLSMVGQWTGTLVGQRSDQSLFRARVRIHAVRNAQRQVVRLQGSVEYLGEGAAGPHQATGEV